jgi:tetratricopeptide (TPR) repeat protein
MLRWLPKLWIALLLAVPCCGPGAKDESIPSPDPGSAPPHETSTIDAPLGLPDPGDPLRAAEILRRALQLREATRYKDADSAFRAALEADPTFQPALVAYGFFLCEATEVADVGTALRLFRIARLISEADLGARLGEGIARRMVGDPERAEPLLRSSLQEADRLAAPNLALARFHLGVLLFESGRFGESREFLRQALDEPQWPATRRAEAAVKLALACAAEERFEAAEEVLREALVLDPEQFAAHHQLARILARRGRSEEAARHQRIHGILRRMLDHTSARFRENLELRIQLHQELVEAYPEYDRAHLKLIREFLGVGRYAEALTAVQSLHGNYGPETSEAELYYLKARAQAGLVRLEDARASARAMRRLNPAVPPDVLRDILGEWMKAAGVSKEVFERTLQEWARNP